MKEQEKQMFQTILQQEMDQKADRVAEQVIWGRIEAGLEVSQKKRKKGKKAFRLVPALAVLLVVCLGLGGFGLQKFGLLSPPMGTVGGTGDEGMDAPGEGKDSAGSLDGDPGDLGDGDFIFDDFFSESGTGDGKYESVIGSEDAVPETAPESTGSDEVASSSSTTTDTNDVSSLLTAGRWNDNMHFSDWRSLIDGQERDWSGIRALWGIQPVKRLVVTVQNEKEKPVRNASVTLFSGEEILYAAKTDNKGVAYLFAGAISGKEKTADRVVISVGEEEKEIRLSKAEQKKSDHALSVTLNADSPAQKLDVMLMLDATGSMGDELSYLSKTLEDVMNRVVRQNGNLPTRLSVNFYRDTEDEYLVRSNPFTNRIKEACDILASEEAADGGDTPEAVDAALEDALKNHTWDEEATKILLLVLDAPPHEEAEVIKRMQEYSLLAAKMGVRIIPVLCSGGDTSCEYLMRSLAMMTGGEYVFLTDDSGIGGSHLKPTIGEYKVEKLNDLLVNLIGEYLQ